MKPRWFVVLINLLFAIIFLIQLIQTALFGGLLPSGLIVVFGLLFVLGALIVFGVRAAWWWFAAFVASMFHSVVISNWVDPLYPPQSAADAAFNLIATGIVIFAVVVYFVRQRDQFQRQSDDLLHNILPEEIAGRLKAGDATIADSFDSASVLFADVADFTPMAAGMSPRELVALLDSVFTTFDGFVEERGLEKIKTVGDYMVAFGVPKPRPRSRGGDGRVGAANPRSRCGQRVRESQDQVAHRDQLGSRRRRNHRESKFAYDLWGDVVNTASRMESEEVPGSIQVSASTHELIKDRFICHPRGVISIKGKGRDGHVLPRLEKQSHGAGRPMRHDRPSIGTPT